jgi:TfoX/Sxy family transcriptional regulator of competence genes
MAFDEELAERIRDVLDARTDVSEKRMFGGLTFLVGGHMSVGIVQDRLMVRVGPEAYDAALRERHATEMDFTGRPMKGYVYVAPAGFESDENLGKWIDRGVAFATSLPAEPQRTDRRTPR